MTQWLRNKVPGERSAGRFDGGEDGRGTKTAGIGISQLVLHGRGVLSETPMKGSDPVKSRMTSGNVALVIADMNEKRSRIL
jgi:hypothetical protein